MLQIILTAKQCATVSKRNEFNSDIIDVENQIIMNYLLLVLGAASRKGSLKRTSLPKPA